MKPKVDGVGQEEETTEQRPNRLGVRHREPTLRCSTPGTPGGKELNPSAICQQAPWGSSEAPALTPSVSPLRRRTLPCPISPALGGQEPQSLWATRTLSRERQQKKGGRREKGTKAISKQQK